MKKLLLLLLAISLAIALAAPSAFASGQDMPSDPGAPVVQTEEYKIVILYTNDTHGRMTGLSESETKEGVTVIPSAKFAGYVKTLRIEGKNVLLLDAGDAVHGTLSAKGYKGASVITLMNTIGYDAMTVGNHEFDYGLSQLLVLKNHAHFPMLATNLTYEDGSRIFDNYTIKEYSVSGRADNKVKIAIIGITTPETAVMAHPKYIKGVKFDTNAVYESLKKDIAAVKKAGVDIVIVLGHIGIGEASEVKSTDIIEMVPGIDIFIDGHSHSIINGGKGEWFGKTLLVSAGEYFQNVGRIEINFAKGEIDSITASLLTSEDFKDTRDDELAKRLLDAYTNYANKQAGAVVGITDIALNGERNTIRTQQTNLGSLITDAMRWKSNADIALVNSGNVSTSIPAGTITYGNVFNSYPYDDTITVINTEGRNIVDALAHGIRYLRNPAGRYPQVSGVEFGVQYMVVETPGSQSSNGADALLRLIPWLRSANAEGAPIRRIPRLSSVTIAGKPIELDKTYTVAISDFLAAGGEGYTMLTGQKVVGEYGSISDAVTEYLKSKQPPSPVPDVPKTGDGSAPILWLAILLLGGLGLALLIRRRRTT